MELKSSAKIFTILLTFAVIFIAVAHAAPNNATTPAPAGSKPKDTLATNATTSGNKTASSEEDCEAEPEPAVAGAPKNGTRQGKQLNPGEKEEYKHEGNANATSSTTASATGGDAAKLEGNSSTTTAAPATGGSPNFTPSSLWANVIFATLLSSFTYSAL